MKTLTLTAPKPSDGRAETRAVAIAAQDKLTVCHDCDLVCADASIERGETAHCPRCHATLLRAPTGSLQASLAMATTAAILFVVLNTNPLLSIKFQGVQKEATLLGAATEMWVQDMRAIALLVVVTTIVAPAIRIATELYLLCCVAASRPWTTLGPSLRLLGALRPWSMVEILMLGILVSLAKLRSVADIVLGPALWSCAVLICVMAVLTTKVTASSVWKWTCNED